MNTLSIILLSIVGVVLVAGLATLYIAIKNAQTVDPNEPFLHGDIGYDD
jgi:hypothetical protein